jgi:hypothetical protein
VKIVLITLLVFIGVMCGVRLAQGGSDFDFSDPKPCPKVDLSRKIKKKVITRFKKEYGLDCYGDASAMMNEIKMLGLYFRYCEPIEIKRGRELLVAAVDLFLEEIEAEKEIHPFLKEYPFKPKRIAIDLFLKNVDTSTLKKGIPTIMSVAGGILEYIIRDPKTDQQVTIYSETYEDAVRKIARSKGQLFPQELDEVDEEDSYAKRSLGMSFTPFYKSRLVDNPTYTPKKWLIKFPKLLGEPPYFLKSSRVSTFANIFFEVPEITSEDILKSVKAKGVMELSVAAEGYLPGEKVTWRICSKNPTVFVEASGYPRPLMIKNGRGRALVEVELVRENPATYYLTVPFLASQTPFTLICKSGDQRTEVVVKGPLEKHFYPTVEGQMGGVAEVEVVFEDKTSRKLELPWGTELLKYKTQ